MYKAFALGCKKALLAALGASATIACLPAHVLAQSLNTAVAQQLQTINSIPCATLRGATPITRLQDGLFTICTRSVGAGGTNPADSTGGGAGTPTTVPSVVSKRLKKARGEEEEAKTDKREPAEATLGFGQWSVFVSGEYENLNRNVTTFADGYDSNIGRLTIGADVRLTEQSVLGAALVGSKQIGGFDGGGNFTVNSSGVLVFGSFLPTAQTFIQATGGYTRGSNERNRVATFVSDDSPAFERTGVPAADFDADKFSAGILAGYDYVAGNVTLGPRLGLDWINTHFKTYGERGTSGLELTFYDNDETSLQSALGVQGSMAISTRYGVLSPQVNLAWRHEFKNDQRDVQVSFVHDTLAKRFIFQTDHPDRDFFELNVGAVVALPHGIQAFVNYRTLLGNSIFNSNAGTIGLRVDL